MTNVQSQMSTVIPKIQKIQQEAVEQVKAKADSAPAPTPAK
jgi:hypothetical protein